MPSALYFLKSICVRETICSPRVVMVCDEKKYNPQGVASSLTSLPRVGCVALADPALSKVQPRWGKVTPCGWCGLSNVQCDEVMAHRVVWWRWVGAVACVPARVAPQGRIHCSFPHTMRVFWYGNAAARTFGRAHRHRPYGFVWVDCM